MKKTPKAIGIINVIFGAITACVGINDIDYDWGIIALVCGLGLLVSGILQLVNKTGKVLGILQLIAGIAEIGLACLCIDYDWGIISGLIGIGMFVIGIVFGALSIIMGFTDIDYDWGVTALFVGIALLVCGIVGLAVKPKEDNQNIDAAPMQ